MFNRLKRVTSAFVAGAVVLGSLVVYPNLTGKFEKVKAAVKYDSASAVNFSTVLGAAVNYGIVANEIIQRSHTETTFATNKFVHVSDNIDVDYIDSTALFLIKEYVPNGPSYFPEDSFIRFGKTTASAIYVEAPRSVLGDAVSHVAYPQTQSGNFRFENQFPAGKDFIVAENPDAGAKVDFLLDRICSPDGDGKAGKGWSYFLQERANSADYKLDSSYIVKSPNTFDVKIDVSGPEFDGKVVYIDADATMIRALGQASTLEIVKSPSSVVVFNIDDDVVEDNRALSIKQPVVTIKDGARYDGGKTAINGGDKENGYAAALQRDYNQAVIFNLMTDNDIELEATGGTVLAPLTKNITLQTGNSSGWVVTNGTFHMNNEFHFLYSGASLDKNGQMHFALNKAFTEKYDSLAAVIQDTSVAIAPDTYEFDFVEYEDASFTTKCDSAEFNDAEFAAVDGTVVFDRLTFTCDSSTSSSRYYIPKGDSVGKNYYFRVTEKSVAPHSISA